MSKKAWHGPKGRPRLGLLVALARGVCDPSLPFWPDGSGKGSTGRATGR